MLKHLMGSKSAPVSPRSGRNPFDDPDDPQFGIEPGQIGQITTSLMEKSKPPVCQPASSMKGTAAELLARNEERRQKDAAIIKLAAHNKEKRKKHFLAKDDHDMESIGPSTPSSASHSSTNEGNAEIKKQMVQKALQ